MSRPDLKSVLEVFRTPASAAWAAERFGWPKAVIEGLLKQLQARGMVVPAEPGVGACRSGCGMCSMQNFCPKSEENPGPEPGLGGGANNGHIWRLTPLGEQSVLS